MNGRITSRVAAWVVISGTACISMFAAQSFADPVNGGATYLDQSRSVSAHTGIDPLTMDPIDQSEFQQAGDFGLFEGDAFVSVFVEEDLGEGLVNQLGGFAHATQESELRPFQISAFGTLEAGAFDLMGGSRMSRAESSFEAMFRLDVPHFFDVMVLSWPFGDAMGRWQIAELVSTDGAFELDTRSPISPFGTVSGRLEPGEYILRNTVWLEVVIFGAGGPQDHIMEMQLTPVPLPAASWMGLATLALLGLIGLRRWAWARRFSTSAV